ncbi:unnamed protein product [Acanthoscelides obtectus]|uniref:Small ribosomal subunit protein mS29 n=1 Tax=Acanthoscelides obtectus TaxID=200917 RepID=A0A9P0P2N7_ACAOB|nr:unnamed protein product [Acanthoscelides obtectus]CAK1639133.1 28S ribosomal protein S29, mitochondrial [Acanthoscelides obtectus]
MLKRPERFIIKCAQLHNSYIQSLHTTVCLSSQERLQSFRTNEENPLNHNESNTAQFYKLLESDKAKLFVHGGLPKSFETQAKTFNETCLMIRQPALDVINCMKNIDYNKPAVRFVLYGKKGTGKSLAMAHILHYAFKQDFLIVHVPWVGNWMRRCKEQSNSESKEGYIDINLDAAGWLLHFKTQNAHILSKPKLKTSRDHVWSKRETTPKDSPLLELIEHGIARIKYASETVNAICEEIKILSNDGKCRTIVAIDGYNAFFYRITRVFTVKKEPVLPEKVTLTEGFLNLTKFDWKNGVIIVTVDEIAIAEKDQISHLPRYLLGKQGFEHLDPFVPILVSNYTKKEVLSCLDYYKERKWIQPYPGLENEVEFVSASNPYKLMKICASL